MKEQDATCEKCGAEVYYEDGIYKTCADCGKQTHECICEQLSVK